MTVYQVQKRVGAVGVYVAFLDTDDFRMALVSALETTSAAGDETRVVIVETGKIVWRHQTNGYDRDLKRWNVWQHEGRTKHAYSAKKILEMSA